MLVDRVVVLPLCLCLCVGFPPACLFFSLVVLAGALVS